MSYSYTAFGEQLIDTSAANAFRYIGHLGYYFDEDTRTINVRQRTYDPDLSVWLSPDPLRFASTDPNLYRYVQNSPLQIADPSGLWPAPIGHHYFPVAEVSHFGSKITDAAKRLAEGYYTGPTNPPHGYTTYGGVRHHDYNLAVRNEFNKYLKEIGKNKRGKVNEQEMRIFIEKRLKSGKGDIGRFNTAVERTVMATRRINPARLTNAQLKTLGKQFRQNRRAFASTRLLGALAAVGGLAVSQAEGFLEVSATSPYLRRAYAAADEGDISGTKEALLGSRARNDAYGLYDELIARGYSLAALDFEKAIVAVFDDIRADGLLLEI